MQHTTRKNLLFMYFAWVYIVLLGSGSAESDPHEKSQLAETLNAQSARYGARAGPKIASSVQARLPACPAAETARKDPRPEN